MQRPKVQSLEERKKTWAKFDTTENSETQLVLSIHRR